MGDSRFRGTVAAALAVVAALAAPGVSAAPKTVCTITINSPDEGETFKRRLPADEYRFVELVQQGRPDWFAEACRSQVRCDALLISGHFDDGTEFYTDRLGDKDALTVHDMQRASCSASCDGLFRQLKEVYLFGCNTLKDDPRNVAGGEVMRSLQRAGMAPSEARRSTLQLGGRYGESNRDRLRHIFKDVPVLYGFSSMAPLGRYAGPMLERYFSTAPAGEVANGRPSRTLLELFGPVSMISVAGVTDADPHAGFRADMCALADEQPGTLQKVAFLHSVLQRDPAEVRLFIDHVERFIASIDAARRAEPGVATALQTIEDDHTARDRLLTFARDADEATMQMRLLTVARQLGWLSPAQQNEAFARMIGQRMARGALGRYEVDLVCASPGLRDGGLVRQLLDSGDARPQEAAHAAVLACMGHGPSHERTLRALTGSDDAELAIAKVYLRHRPLADVADVRSVTTGITRMSTPSAQVRALETLGTQRLADPQSLREIVRLFATARSLPAQRAIANILIRADTRTLGRDELAQALRRHRLKSSDGQDVIDALIRMLQLT